MADANEGYFPKDFVWGASTSAHQIEGGNRNDWSQWEIKNADRLAREAEGKFASIVPDWELIKAQAADPQNYVSGRAADHYRRYKEDIAIAKELGLKAFRFSLEWSRIEPRQGEFNEEALAHYRGVIDELKRNGIEPWITLWHRTNPVWIADMGGWENRQTVDFYLRYAETAVRRFGDVKIWMPLNEPIMSLSGGYLGGVYPPSKKSLPAAWKVFRNFALAHKGAYNLIHNLVPDASVGIPHAAVYTEAYRNKWYNRLPVFLVHYFADWKFLNAIKTHADFIGIQYYSRGLLNLALHPKSGRARFVEEISGENAKSDMGWEIYPEGIYRFIKMAAKKYPNKSIYITENGVTDARDAVRARFIRDHLRWILKAIGEGADVRGYFYWSLIDNLEWDKGFWPRFGLAEVDYRTMQRTIRPSAREFAEIIKNNGLA